jgi:multisubunit Na+/H+ antiporter MnhB subunit
VTLGLGFDAALALLVVAVAASMVAAREAFAAVVGFVAFGLLLTLAWVRLAAPDVALTEAAIGSGLGGVLLVAVAARLDRIEAGAAGTPTPAVGLRVAAAAAAVLVTAGLAAAVLLLPRPAPSLAPAAIAHLALTGLGNPVTAVLMAYRAIDTLLEVVVLLLALVGIWSLGPDRCWRGRPAVAGFADRNGVLAYLARVLPPFGLLVGVHLFWVGSVAPGGEFQSATVLAAMWLLTMMAGLIEPPPVASRRLRLLLVGGAGVFFAVGFAGFALAGGFLAYPPQHAKFVILAIELPLTASIAAILGLLVAGPPTREIDRDPAA